MKPLSVINDPIHSTMDFTSAEKKTIKPIIDSAVFQRLRHIKQLGLGDMVFPGAVHTRFNHGIGACFLAKKIVLRIKQDLGNLTQWEETLPLIAGLIHDIGHGPFSHAFEKLFCDKNEKSTVDHEQWTEMFMDDMASNNIVNMNDFQKHDIINAIEHKPLKKIRQVIGDIVSSQLDCDRLDYLLRDSHFCGVTYGTYDLNWLMGCITVVTESKKSPRLGINRKGLGAVEQLLISRRLMHQNVYYNGKVKGAEFILIEFLKGLVEDINKKPEDLEKILSSQLFQFLSNAYELIDSAKTKGSGELKRETKKFKSDSFRYYKQLTDYDVWSAIRAVVSNKRSVSKKTAETASRLYERKLPSVFSLEKSSIEGAAFIVEDYRAKNNIAAWKLGILDLGVKSYKGDDSQILILQGNGTTKSLSSASHLIGSVTDVTESTCFLRIDDEIKSETKDLIKKLNKKQYLATGY